MRYKNTKTGAIIDSPFKVVGKYWVEHNEQKETKETKEYVDEEINLEEMTKTELVEFAKEHKIKVDEKEVKAVVIETIAKAFE